MRVPCTPVARLNNHRACVNGIAWAPHSSCHICTAGNRDQTNRTMSTLIGMDLLTRWFTGQCFLASGLYYQIIMAIVSDDREWSLYYKCVIALALPKASVINCDHMWQHSLERHSWLSYDDCLYYRPQVSVTHLPRKRPKMHFLWKWRRETL